MDIQDMDGIDSDKFVIFQQDDLHIESFPLMKEIRRQGKLCDVTLKVSFHMHLCTWFYVFVSVFVWRMGAVSIISVNLLENG